jgi:hypothetical protein
LHRPVPTSPCVIFAMGQVQWVEQIILGYQNAGVTVMHQGNTQSSWDFWLQSQRNYLIAEISKSRSASER